MKAHMPGSHRNCYMNDEAAREQADAIEKFESTAAQYTLRALAIWIGAFIGTAFSALVMHFLGE